jgi:hypothetical protein
MCVILALTLYGMVRLPKDTFVINWTQTAVAAAMAIGTVIVTALAIFFVFAMWMGGLERTLNKRF